MTSTMLMSVETTLLLSVAALYIIHCPFNKVEESFNTQAVHDIVNIFPNNFPSSNISYLEEGRSKGLDSNQPEIAIRSHLPWDHILFPGVVPRTFVGALMVGLPMRLAKYFMLNGVMSDGSQLEDDHDLTSQFILQIGSRFALSSFLVLSMSVLLRAIQKRYGLAHRLCFLIITISQFHYIFYAGRFIPNTFAAILANLMFASWINRQYSKSIIYAAFCVVIFRFDTSIFFGWLLFDGVFIRRLLPLSRVLSIGIPAGLVSIMITFLIDSLFWARPVWPEFEGLYFNVWLNKSHEWGIQPYLWYVYSCIPRIMLSSVPLLLLADHKFTRDYLIPCLAFIFTYSFLPHKELRFILFVTPLLNLCAASGLMNVYYYLNKLFLYLRARIGGQKVNNSRSPSKRNKRTNSCEQNQRSYIATVLFALVIVGMFMTNLFICFVFVRISSHNYPGGQAAISLGVTKELLDAAKKSIDDTSGLRDLRSDVGVYVNNLAAQTGVSRFLQVNGAYYSKTPKLDKDTFKKSYHLVYLVLEPKEITEYLRVFCPLDRNQEKLLENGADKWRQGNDEIKCTLPNQSEMYCSILDSIDSFKAVNVGGLLRKLRRIRSIKTALESLDDNGFIKTQIALHIIRCSTKSKFNPFS